jgi:hypothetical protein
MFEWVNKEFLMDLGERALMTFVEGFLAAYLLGGMSNLEASNMQAAAVGGLAAVLSMVKSVAARKTGSPNSAALLP